ncbi:hypothetical protein Tco_0506311 [Tanacetum coccineum]
MNNFHLNLDPKHDLSIVFIEIHEHDLDIIDYDSFGSDLDDEIDYERITQLKELRRKGKKKKQYPNKYYFYLGPQFATKEIVKRRVKKLSVETSRKLILMGDHAMRKSATNPGIPVRAVQDQMQKQFDVGV